VLRFAPLVLSNLRRRLPRTIFTLASIAVAFLLYGLLAAVRNGFEANVQLAGEDRLMTMHKVSIVQPLPLAYASEIASIPGVSVVSHQSWFGGRYQDEPTVIMVYPVPPESYLKVYPDILLSAAERARWLRDRTGAVVGRGLARRYGWKVGDRIPLRSDIYQRKDGSYVWEFTVDGVYDNREPGGDDTSVLFQYDFLDEARASGKGTVGWYVERITDPKRAAAIAAAIDARFANSSAETKTGTEKAFIQAFANQTGDIGAIVGAIGVAVFFTMLLVSANTMAQSVRERTAELGVLKTLGFSDRAVLALVIAEAVLLTVAGGVLGLSLALAAVSHMSTTLKQYLSAFLLTPQSLWLGLALMIGLGIAAGALPARRALRLKVADALAAR